MSSSNEPGINKEDLIASNRRYARQRRQELEDREKELLRLQRECEEIRRELYLIDAWLDTMEGIDRSDDQEYQVTEGSSDVLSYAAPNVMDGEVRGDRLRDEVVKILKESNPRELYYREILSRLNQKGLSVGGKDPGLNLIAHLAKEPRVKRGAKRGIYCLDDTYVNQRGSES